MAQGRGSAASLVIFLGVAMLCVLIRSPVAEAATFVVGGSAGWDFNTNNWPQGKQFHAGDVLVFNYDPEAHNVVEVNQAGYTSCTRSGALKVYSSGHDSITLTKGTHYFICSIPGHCQLGMKISVTAT